MNEARSRGALVLLCRSQFANHFSSFKPILLERLKPRFGDRIQFVDIQTPEALVDNLLTPSSLFDVAELHILAEYDSGRLLVNAVQNRYIEAGAIANTKASDHLGIASGELLPDTTAKLWYLSTAEGPGIDMLNEWSDYFKRRFFFLPMAQLKSPAKPSIDKQSMETAREKAARKVAPYRPSSVFEQLSLSKVIVILAVIGGLNHILSHKPKITSDYDQVVDYEDSSLQIAALTRDMKSDAGSLVEHSWVFQRTRWNFTFFVASEWLHYSERELDAAATTDAHGHQYWARVYRKILNSSNGRLDNVARALWDHGRQMNLDRHDLASFVLSFVQHISYRIPSNNLELLTPPQTVREAYGDCDSKSLLYALLLQKLGYDAVIYVNRGLSHAMAGVNTTATGQYMSHHGARYYFAETTAIGHRIGQLRGTTGGWHLIPL